MEKLTVKYVRTKLGFFRLALLASAGSALFFVTNAFAQNPEATPGGRAGGAAAGQPNAAVAPEPAAGAPAPAGAAEATAERVIVTGSNIPTAEETGPNPVDTYRAEDIAKLGVRNSTDLTTFLPQQAGGTVNLNIGNGGDGTVQLNLRGILPKETLVLIDGKRVASGSLGAAGFSGGVDINLIPFSMIDHVDFLKDGASAVYGADAVAGVANFFLIHKFRGLEIGGTYGNTNLGASNDMFETEGWIKAGTGDDKTDIVVIADFYDRSGLFSRDRGLSANGNFTAFGGFDGRSGNFPGHVGGFVGRRLIPSLFFSTSPGPPPHSAPNVSTSPYYVSPTSPIFNNGNGFFNGTLAGLDGNFVAFNFAAFTPALPPADRQTYYASFTRDLCDKYLTVFADFKYSRSFFNASLAAVPFTPDPFKRPTGADISTAGISVPIQNPFNPFTVGDDTWISPTGQAVPVTTRVRFRGINDTGPRSEKFTYNDMLFDAGLKGEMGEFGDYFKNWNWEVGFRYSRNEGTDLSIGEVSQQGLRDALLDTNPATAFNPFGGFFHRNTLAADSRVYVNLHNSGEFELPLAYATINGDIFNLPAGPLSFAVGGEYHGERFNRFRDSLNETFSSIGSTDGQSFRVNRDVWGMYQELRIPVTSPTWNFPGAYSLEFDIAEREEWYSQNTSRILPSSLFPGTPAVSSQYDTQKPKFSVRWQPLDPKWIGAVTFRGSYSEAFHAPTLSELTPASSQNFPVVADPFSSQTDPQIEERVIGNPRLQPETAYEWTYGAVYSPSWAKGLTLSADWWHIDLRSIVASLGADLLIATNPPPASGIQNGPVVFRGPSDVPGEPGPVTLVIDPNQNVAQTIFEGLDYEAIYIFDMTNFGGPDIGRFTGTINGTWISRAELQPGPGQKRFGINDQFLPTGFTLTSSIPSQRANASLYYDGPAGTWMQGLDVGAVVHWINTYNDDNLDLTAIATIPPITAKPQTPRDGPIPQRARTIASWTTLDLIFNYTFNMPAPEMQQPVPGYSKDGGKNVKVKDGKEKNVMPVSTASYSECGWRSWLNGTTVTLGMQNVFDEDPPFVGGSFENGYDESLTTIKGRFWYAGIKKRF